VISCTFPDTPLGLRNKVFMPVFLFANSAKTAAGQMPCASQKTALAI
jgi:hypothetical protein